MNSLRPELKEELGFSLVELLVTLVVSMVILAGLMASFTSQYEEYRYQNKRMDAVQDLEFVANFIADDIRSSITSGGVSIAITDSGTPLNTTGVTMTVWESDEAFWGTSIETVAVRTARMIAADYRAVRYYDLINLALGVTNTSMFASQSLRYDRNTQDGNTSPQEVLRDVTAFRIFRDVAPTIAGSWIICDAPGPCDCVKPVGFASAPCGLPIKTIGTAEPGGVDVQAYTILLEMAVDAGYRGGSFVDAAGNSVVGTADPRKRVWRYVQVYPGTTD